MLEHMIGSGEDRGGEGADRPFRGGSGAQALELRLEIAAVFAGGRPGALDQGVLERRGPSGPPPPAREVTAENVAHAFQHHAVALETPADATTVDGGNIAAALR